MKSNCTDDDMRDIDTDADSRLAKKFKGLWCRARQLHHLDDLNVEAITTWAHLAGLDVQSVVEKQVGAFVPISVVALTVSGKTAYFPTVSATEDPVWGERKRIYERIAAIWSKAEWFEPLWVPREKIGPLLAAVEHRSKEEAIRQFDYHTSTIYTLAFQAVCIEQFIAKSRTLAPFYPIVREAYLAFYAGHRAASIAALIPVMEGALQRISVENVKLHVKDKIDRVIDRACELAARIHFDGNWVPDEYTTTDYLYAQDERIFIFQTFRQWLKGVFFCDTDLYEGETWLNRHLFAHGASTDWANDGNFARLVVALATFGVIESWHDESNSVPLLLPEMSNNSVLLWQHAQLQAEGQIRLRLLEQLNYQQHGQIVPPRPTDDGSLLRKTCLTDECIKDLVRPLRDAGWDVEMEEPDEQGLQMKVIARSGETEIHVALLFSCTTAPEIYRELAKNCVAVLYVGAPYQQKECTQGVDVHVGPVAGWQPPRAPTKT